MPAGVVNERNVRKSDGVKPKVSALRTGETLLNRQEAPTSHNPRHGASLFDRGRVRLCMGKREKPKTPHLYPLPFERGEARQSQSAALLDVKRLRSTFCF